MNCNAIHYILRQHKCQTVKIQYLTSQIITNNVKCFALLLSKYEHLPKQTILVEFANLTNKPKILQILLNSEYKYHSLDKNEIELYPIRKYNKVTMVSLNDSSF